MEREGLEERILRAVRDKPLESDFLISLFAVSACSYRRGTICKPFPIHFIDANTEHCYSDLELHLSSIPPLRQLQEASAISKLSSKTLQLLDWIINPANFELKAIPVEKYEKDNVYYKNVSSVNKPSYIFEVEYTNTSNVKKRRDKYISDKMNYTYAYHGSSLENIHCIINNGLSLKFSKETSLFGTGIYLALDNRVAENFFSMGQIVRKHSFLNDTEKLGVIMGCEVGEDSTIKFVGANYQEGASTPAHANKKQYIVANREENVLIKHLLVFENGPAPKKRYNKCVLMMLLYLGILIFIVNLKSTKTLIINK